MCTRAHRVCTSPPERHPCPTVRLGGEAHPLDRLPLRPPWHLERAARCCACGSSACGGGASWKQGERAARRSSACLVQSIWPTASQQNDKRLHGRWHSRLLAGQAERCKQSSPPFRQRCCSHGCMHQAAVQTAGSPQHSLQVLVHAQLDAAQVKRGQGMIRRNWRACSALLCPPGRQQRCRLQQHGVHHSSHGSSRRLHWHLRLGIVRSTSTVLPLRQAGEA